MPDVVMIDFSGGLDQQAYDQVNDRINPVGNPPAGLIFHCAGPGPDGTWRIVDVWDSRATFDRFLQERIVPTVGEVVGEDAMAQAPPEIKSWPVHNHTIGEHTH